MPATLPSCQGDSFFCNFHPCKSSIRSLSNSESGQKGPHMNQDDLLISTVLTAWKQVIDRLGKKFDSLSDDDLQREIAPGRNRVYYLLGHLTAVHDLLLPLLRLGDRLHPEFD